MTGGQGVAGSNPVVPTETSQVGVIFGWPLLRVWEQIWERGAAPCAPRERESGSDVNRGSTDGHPMRSLPGSISAARSDARGKGSGCSSPCPNTRHGAVLPLDPLTAFTDPMSVGAPCLGAHVIQRLNAVPGWSAGRRAYRIAAPAPMSPLGGTQVEVGVCTERYGDVRCGCDACPARSGRAGVSSRSPNLVGARNSAALCDLVVFVDHAAE